METERGTPFELEDAIPVLEATPEALRALLARLPEPWLNYVEDLEAWSPRTVVVHYIHNERTNWLPRLRVFLSEAEDRRFPPFHQLPELRAYADRTVSQLLAEFADLRTESVSILRDLDLGADDLAREAEHPTLGAVNLGQLLSTWVVHDLNHLHQITKTMALRYRDSVGPWRQFLALIDV